MHRTAAVPSFSRAQRIFLACCFAVWLGYACLVPQSNSNDVYLFRDAALNWLDGLGFRTASYERSTSFAPLLYASYTPLTQWVFVLFAWVFGVGWRAASLCTFTLAAISSVAACALGTRMAGTHKQRWALVALAGAALPAGFLAAENDRPESCSFVLLLMLLWVPARARQRPELWIWQGLLTGLAFLAEPFAGVLGALLVAGAWLGVLLQERAQSGSCAGWARRALVNGVLAAGFAVLPIAVTGAAFLHLDPQALTRFEEQAKYAGAARSIHYSLSADRNEALQKHDTYLRRLGWGLGAELLAPLSALHLLSFLVMATLGLLVAAAGRGAPQVWALLGITVLLPLVLFPLQPNYQVLTSALLPAALALGWAAWQPRTERQGRLVFAMFAAQLSLTVPAIVLRVIIGIETRASYLQAQEQGRLTGSYLQAHGLGNAVLMVPSSDYYIYKPFHRNIYGPAYYAHVEGTFAIGGLVECKNSSKDLRGTPLPPEMTGNWMLLSHQDQPALVTLLGHRLMRRNWSLGCDVYVRRRDGL